jgi:hypothetical protein
MPLTKLSLLLDLDVAGVPTDGRIVDAVVQDFFRDLFKTLQCVDGADEFISAQVLHPDAYLLFFAL